ncbi:MAG TPA: hypothetical protein VM115_00290 [Vicinamibacterales bacterium]|nr:hypothetical protein [Vicinamibacterales bacterium]
MMMSLTLCVMNSSPAAITDRLFCELGCGRLDTPPSATQVGLMLSGWRRSDQQHRHTPPS